MIKISQAQNEMAYILAYFKSAATGMNIRNDISSEKELVIKLYIPYGSIYTKCLGKENLWRQKGY